MPASDNDPRQGLLKEIAFMPSTMETIDQAMYTALDEDWNLHATTNKGWRKTPVIWVGAERAFQVKNDKELRDSSGMLKLPLITLERVSMEKDPTRKGMAPANILPVNDNPGGSITIARRIKQYDTAKNANANAARKTGALAGSNVGLGDLNNREMTRPGVAKMFDVGPGTASDRTVYETISIPMPSYIVVGYKITIQTEYQQQMNELLTPFIAKTGNHRVFVINSDGHRFEAFIENSYGYENNIATLEEEDRAFKTTIDIKVEAYLIGEGPNAVRPKIVKRQSALLAIANERTIINNVEFPQKFVSLSAPSVIASITREILSSGGGGGTGSGSDSTAIKYTDYVVAESVSGTKDGTNATFTFFYEPRPSSVTVTLNGLTLTPGEDDDYTVAGTTLTLASEQIPEADDVLTVTYIKAAGQ